MLVEEISLFDLDAQVVVVGYPFSDLFGQLGMVELVGAASVVVLPLPVQVV